MKEYFEEWTKKTQKPVFTIAELKRAVRSENMPHNQLGWKGNAHDAVLLDAEDVYFGLKLLSRIHPDPAVESMIHSAFFSLRSAIAHKIKGLEPARQHSSESDPAYKQATQLQEAFTAAVDRALDRLMVRAHRR